MTNPTPNDDEGIDRFIGNFHKTLPHDEYGEVDPAAYHHFRDLCSAIESGVRMDFESVPRGVAPAGAPFNTGANTETAKLTSPMAGAADESFGPTPRSQEMIPAPGILSESTAAEMVELYWMALLRDKSLQAFHPGSTDPGVAAAVQEIAGAFNLALSADKTSGALQLGLDLPSNTAGALDIRPETLFRCGLPDEQYGPLVSQFFLRDVPYGTQMINQSQRPYSCEDYLITYEDWLRAQNTGKDAFGRDYANCNFYNDRPNTTSGSDYYAGQERKIATMRDLARFVNRDALHQAYFNAALFLDAAGAPLDEGNPYRDRDPATRSRGGRYSRQSGFATLGGPDLLTLVSEVASRALKVVWRQKWLVHRRARPEVYGGLVHMQLVGPPASPKRDYGLPAVVTGANAASIISSKNSTYFLPMAFSAGSPSHPAYGAGHATVAGACVTILKAWFDETIPFYSLAGSSAKRGLKEPSALELRVLASGSPVAGKDVKCDYTFQVPAEYTGTDTKEMTVGGELNKLASNVAMGRSMGGVHWRSDNTRSLRLGEQIAIEILRKRVAEYAEKAVSFTFISFDRKTVHITPDGVSVK